MMMNPDQKSSFIDKFDPPVFEGDEEKTYQAKMLNLIFITAIIFMAILFPFVLFNDELPLSLKIFDGLILAASLVLRYLLFKGKVKETGLWMMVIGFCLITCTNISLQSITTPTTSTYIFLVIAAGILFNLRGIVISSTISSLIVGGLILSINLGIISERSYPVGVIQWVIYTLFFCLVGSLTYFSLQNTVKALDRSKKEIAERVQIESKLRLSEARFRNLFDQTHDAVLLIDLQGKYLLINQHAADMLGYTVQELLTLSYMDVTAEPDRTIKIVDRLIKEKNIPIYERNYRRKDGSTFPVEVVLELIRDDQGNPLYIQCLARDISQRKHDEEALKAANEQLKNRISENERLQEQLKEQALRDPLTGLYNRRYLTETLPREFASIKRLKSSLSIIISDLDHFKQINDTHGHQTGDMILVEIAQLIKRHTRDSDILCRYGGEEFILVLSGATLEDAKARAEEIRQFVENWSYLSDDILIKTTISMGIANFPAHGSDADEIIIKADKALYQSKQTGRNRVAIWSED